MKLPKIYEPSEYERDIYALWEKSESFKPQGGGDSYSIVMPPPNANAGLHIGYELTAALEDILIRYHRLKGERTLLVPGADHAGFETWVVYERQLAKAGKSRFDFTREELYRQVWDFVAANQQNFGTQLRRMGVSCDWSRFRFTLDEKIVRRAYETFKKMWDEGLIYRGERLVNFCTYHGTAFADIEVEYKEECGHLWFIRYPLVAEKGEIIVATTRPETIFGDTAVAVNSKDKRYKRFVGKTVRLPLTEREIPIIVDDFVDEHFGTGAVKITPAHDPNDFEAGERHDLPRISIIDYEGKMTNVPDAYRGLTVEEARKEVVHDLEAQAMLVSVEDYAHNVGHCYKCDTVIQPLLREQWFVDMQPLAKRAIKSLRAGEITFYPGGKKDQLIAYLENLRDWNVSRQIAWGIPIPAFQNVDEPQDWIYDERTDQEIIEVGGKTYRRDPDVFDTWFSSSSWPYATLDFPDSQDAGDFYPLSVMETGGEILYPWVSRMIILGLYVTGHIPFKDVYIHGYVMAEDGTKMSKSIGNVVDPMPVIEKYGSDALRMGIIASRAPAINRGYDARKVEDARNFCNKLWNIARYVEDAAGDKPDINGALPETIADHWVLSKLQQTTGVVSADLDDYRFAEAHDALYHFVWDDLADWYIEASKVQPNNGLLALVLEAVLKLAHSFAPFVTETIWQTLAWQPDSLLITSHWPEHLPSGNAKQSKVFERIQTLAREVRNLAHTLDASKPHLYYGDEPVLETNAELVRHLARLGDIEPRSTGATEGLQLTHVPFDCWLDVDRSKVRTYAKQLGAKQQARQQTIKRLEARLANKDYVLQAPPAVVEQTRQQLAEAQELLAAVEQERRRFAALH